MCAMSMSRCYNTAGIDLRCLLLVSAATRTASELTAWQHVRNLCRMLRGPFNAQAHASFCAAAVAGLSSDGRQTVLHHVDGEAKPTRPPAWQSGCTLQQAIVHLTWRCDQAQELVASDAQPSHEQPDLV
jgi:hypothetical protein